MKNLIVLGWGVLAASVVYADTLTWKGGASGALSSAANWTSDGAHTSPQPGDTVKFASATTLTTETFDLGTGGLTIENGADVTSSVKFTGSGVLTKSGVTCTVSSFTGNGKIQVGTPASIIVVR